VSAQDGASVPAASAAFSAHAPEYTALRRRLVPDFDGFYGSAIDALKLPGVGPVRRVLDLGAGTGLMSALVSAGLPEARFDLLDGSAAMLAEARTVLAGVVGEVYVQDMAFGLPGGEYDAVISGLAIHHLEDPDKRLLFRRIWDLLRPGGIFVNAEQVGGTTRELDRVYEDRWAADVLSQGASPTEIADARRRREHDRCASVSAQLEWLSAAGFATVECVYKHWGMATIIAIRGGAR
jgi:tRNA (cmo5U34)-methyltransferase